MSNDTAYNGWTNRATWLVNVWFNPEHKGDIAGIREMLEDELEEKFGSTGFWRDFINLDTINWDELEGAIEPDEDDEDGDD